MRIFQELNNPFHSLKKKKACTWYLDLISCAAADPGGTPPPVAVKTSPKKECRQRRPLIFHVSWQPPPPFDHPGSNTACFKHRTLGADPGLV